MNPYDVNERPGAHFVAEMLGVSEVSTLNITYRPGDPLYRAATRVIGTAYELDDLHDRVAHAAQATRRALAPVEQGEFHGSPSSHVSLRTSLRRVDHLVSQQNATYERLSQSIFAYRRLLPVPDASLHSGAVLHELNQTQGLGRHDDWALAGDRQLRALEAVEAGGLRFRLTGIGDDPYLSDGTGRRPHALVETVQRLVADGLLRQDTEENLYWPGQLLSLAPAGEAALREARTATPRVSAALSRSNSPANPGPIADSAVVPVTKAAGEPSRSR